MTLEFSTWRWSGAEPAPVPAGAMDEGEMRPAPPRARIMAVLGAVVLAPLLICGLFAYEAWRVAWRNADEEVLRMSDAAAQYARRLLEGQVLRLDRANDLLAGLSDAEIRAREPALHDALRTIAGESAGPGQETFYLFVYDRNGHALVSSNILPVVAGRPMMERSFNRALRPADAPRYYISPLYIGRDTGRLFFTVSARRQRTGNGLPPGEYDGVVNASLYLDHVNPALEALAASPGDKITLLRSDGAFLARTGGFGDDVREGVGLPAGGWMLNTMTSGTGRQLRRGVSEVDGVQRSTAFQRVEGGVAGACDGLPRPGGRDCPLAARGGAAGSDSLLRLAAAAGPGLGHRPAAARLGDGECRARRARGRTHARAGGEFSAHAPGATGGKGGSTMRPPGPAPDGDSGAATGSA